MMNLFEGLNPKPTMFPVVTIRGQKWSPLTVSALEAIIEGSIQKAEEKLKLGRDFWEIEAKSQEAHKLVINKQKNSYYAQLMEANKDLGETRQALMEYEEMYAKAGLPTKLFGLPVIIIDSLPSSVEAEQEEPEDSEDQEDEEGNGLYIELPEGVQAVTVTFEF